MSQEDQSVPMEIDDLTDDPQKMDTSNDQDFNGSSAESQDSRQHLDQLKHQNITTGQTNKSDLQPEKDLYTADTGGQNSSPPQSVMTPQNTVDQTQVQAEQGLIAQMTQSGQLSNVQALSLSSSDGQQNRQFLNAQDLNTAGPEHQVSTQPLDPINIETITRGQSNKSETHAVKDPPVDVMTLQNKVDRTHLQAENLQASSAEGRDIRSSLDKQMHQDITMVQTNKSDSQPEKDICKNSDVNTTQSQPPAPQDIATFKIKIIWSTQFLEKYKYKLELALQKWFAKQEKKGEVSVLQVMNDGTCAEVEITPSTAPETLKKHGPVSLNFKHGHEEVNAQICLDETQSVAVLQNTSKLDKNRIPSSKMKSAMPETSVVSEDSNNGGEVAAVNSAPDEVVTNKMSTGLPVPLYLYWYIHHAYKKELELIKEQHGVSISAEVSVSITPNKSSSPDSVSKASDDFQQLVSGCVEGFSTAAINHNDMDSDFIKETLHYIQSEKAKMMFTMSASDCLFFGPKKPIEMIQREVGTTRLESRFNDKSSQMDVDNNFSPQSRSSFDMDTKDLPTQLEMDKVHWDLINLSYKEQLSQLETKYGVSFHEEKLQKNVIKVQARSTGFQHINLERHALRALTQHYQKLALAAVSCELRNPTYKTTVTQIVENLQRQHYCVVAADVFSPWKLVGLPEHLGPAIAHIEKALQRNVFDDKMKKMIGYSGDIPQARGISWNQMPDYGAGAVGEAARDEGVNFIGQSKADTGFNEGLKDNSKHDSKGAHAEEETCTICMDSFINKTKLKCGHEFCQECITSSIESLGSICPVCKEVFGKLEGNQPDGTMNAIKNRMHLPGHPQCGTIEITYIIPSGIQTKKHPNPGKPFHGARRLAYLPDNSEGNEVLALLQRAFDQKLIFTVGTSTTSGLENAVTWNDIHHKTNTSGGPQCYGYPDPDYLKRVKDELKAKGIE